MINRFKVSPFGSFWRVTRADGSLGYHDKNMSYQSAAALSPKTAPTVVHGFALFDVNDPAGTVIDVFPTREQAEAKSQELGKIVNEQEVEPVPESSGDDLLDSADPIPINQTEETHDDNDPDPQPEAGKTVQRAGRKPVRGTGRSRT